MSPPVPQDVRQVSSTLDYHFGLYRLSLLAVVIGLFHRHSFTPFHSRTVYIEGSKHTRQNNYWGK